MVDLVLTRTGCSSVATTGRMVLPTGELLYSIECPWQDNAPDVSCVPEGRYVLMPYSSPAHGATWFLDNAVLGVGDCGARRSYCELHSANWARQLEGCIAFGLDGIPMYDPVRHAVEPAVESSQDAIEVLLMALGPMSPGHTLTIVRNTS